MSAPLAFILSVPLVLVTLHQSGFADDLQAVDDRMEPATVLAAIETRELLIESIDARIERVESPGSDWVDYAHAIEEYTQRVARFYNIDREPHRPASDTHTNRPAPEFFRLRSLSSGEIRVDLMSGPEPSAEPRGYWFFRGDVWEWLVPDQSRVILLEKVNLPPVFQALGLGVVINGPAGNMFPRSALLPQSLHASLVEQQAAGMLSEPEVIVEDGNEFIQFKTWVSRNNNANYMEVRMLFDVTNGLALRRVEAVDVQQENDKFKASDMPTGFNAEWSAFEEMVPGVWLPRALNIDAWRTVAVPIEGDDFVQLVVDGKPSVTNGNIDIDFSATKLNRYLVATSEFKVSELRINAASDTDDIYPADFPAGTIVEDRREEAVYQLEGVSSAIDEELRRTLEGPATERELAEAGKTSTGARTLLIVNMTVLILLVIGFFLWNRKR